MGGHGGYLGEGEGFARRDGRCDELCKLARGIGHVQLLGPIVVRSTFLCKNRVLSSSNQGDSKSETNGAYCSYIVVSVRVSKTQVFV